MLSRKLTASLRHVQDVIKDEVAVAYGRRSITKVCTASCSDIQHPCWFPHHWCSQLIAVLALEEEELPDNLREHALRIFNALLTTQEQKTGMNLALPRLQAIRVEYLGAYELFQHQ